MHLTRLQQTVLLGTAAAAAAALTAVASGSAGAATVSNGASRANDAAAAGDQLPSPPRPPSGLPTQPAGYQAPTAVAAHALAPRAAHTAAAPAAVATPAGAYTFGANGNATTLVLYDTTDTWGWLGELYAMGAGNLASHFGKVTAEPVADYVAGQVNSYTATVYIGSTYNEPIPTAFLSDVLATTHPVVWAGDNIWQLSGTSGSTTDTAFQSTYGWDPSTSYFDTTDNVTAVGYKGQTLTRSASNTGGVLAPHITNSAAVTVLANADCSASDGTATTCASIAQSTGTSFPWAVRSANLTYVGEVPFSYLSETDRYIAFSDLLFNALAPTATPAHDALVRLEDVSPVSDPALLVQFATYLHSQGVPFSVGVIPEYTDPNGVDDNGRAQTVTLAQRPLMVAALATVKLLGGTVIEHGYTHQYSNVPNPYDGVTADDFEFYRAQCSSTPAPPYSFDNPCPNTDWVIEEGPVPGDSQSWAAGRVAAGRKLFSAALIPLPTIWETPHYAASAADYAGIGQYYSVRYERDLFFGGQLTGQAVNYSHVFGQFFPYVVHDVYGSAIVPENLGDDEPTTFNNNPPRTPADIVHEAQLNLAVTQGTASFFIHSDYDPISDLEAAVQGIKGLGYTFVSPATILAGG